jgi:hypothetical protein
VAPSLESFHKGPLAAIGPEQVLAVLSPACDLQRQGAKRVLLLVGEVRPLGPTTWTYKEEPTRTPVLRVSTGETFWIKWDLKHIGVIPLLLSVFAIAHDRDVAFYKDGSFLRELNGEQMLVLTKAPERFEIQYCKIEGVRAELFERLLAALKIQQPEDREIELLDLVKNLCVFVAQLPAYARNTKRLSPTALAVRQAILEAREPSKLLFSDLPMACGFEPIEAKSASGGPVKNFVKALKLALDELRSSFPELQDRLRKRLQEHFDGSGSFQECRIALTERTQRICLTATEPKFKAFCLRLLDDVLSESDWLESIGSHLRTERLCAHRPFA